MKRLFLFCIALVMLSAVVAYAHGGRTDSKGGHHVGGTSEYHYHHGYPAHDHINGECPYDLKDNLSVSSGSDSMVTSAPTRKSLSAEEIIWIVVGSVYMLVGFVLCAYRLKRFKDAGWFCILFFPSYFIICVIGMYFYLPINFIVDTVKKRRKQKLANKHHKPPLAPKTTLIQKKDYRANNSFDALVALPDDKLAAYFQKHPAVSKKTPQNQSTSNKVQTRYLIEDEASGMLLSISSDNLDKYFDSKPCQPDPELQAKIIQRLMELKEQTATPNIEAFDENNK